MGIHVPLTSSNPNAQGAGIFHHEPAQAPRLEFREAIRDPRELKVSCTPHQLQVQVAPTSLLLPNYPQEMAKVKQGFRCY